MRRAALVHVENVLAQVVNCTKKSGIMAQSAGAGGQAHSRVFSHLVPANHCHTLSLPPILPARLCQIALN